MRQTPAPQTPSIASDLGSLAGLYRTVFWMIGRKSQYGRVWPPGAHIAEPHLAAEDESPVFDDSPAFEDPPSFEVENRSAVEVVARE